MLVPTARFRLVSKVLFALFATCAIGSMLAWAILLTSVCSNPRRPMLETRHTIPYNCHGMTVYMTPLEDALRTWLVPIGCVFIVLTIVAGALVVFSYAKVRISISRCSSSSQAEGPL